MRVTVKIGRFHQTCTLVGDGICKFCGEEIVWGTLPSGKYIPLEPEPEAPGVMETHFNSCAPRPAPRAAGIAMSETVWRQLIRLCHPDRHHGGENEQLANDLTRWLLEQRPRLTK